MATIDLLQESGLLPPKHASSLVWSYFGFKNNGGSISDHSHVSCYCQATAKKLLCIPATSTPSERLFSTAGYVINSKRACLDADNVNMLCFLAENLP